jgi:hypothetical protein
MIALNAFFNPNLTMLIKRPWDAYLTPFSHQAKKIRRKSSHGHSMVKKPFVHQIFLLCVSAKALLAGWNYAAAGKNCQNSAAVGTNYSHAKRKSCRHRLAIRTGFHVDDQAAF